MSRLFGRAGGLVVARLRGAWPAVVVGAVFFGLWEGLVRLFDVQEFLLPRPTSIVAALSEQWAGQAETLGTVPLREAGLNTAWIAVSGLILGVALGAALALIVTRFVRFGGAVTPLAVAINATPIVALAPIFNAWFGLTSTFSNQAVVIVVVFFPVFINTAKGLTEVHPEQLELLRSYGASEMTILRRVRAPNALPFFLTSLRIAAPLSVIAAIVAEYFGGPQNRLGPVITQNASFARYDAAWAAITVASAVGLVLFLLAIAAEWLAMPYRRKREAPQ
ncbi:MAG: ABC transporter permease subunit [Actinomycetota bacterium]